MERVTAGAEPAYRSGGLGAPPGARGMGHGHARSLGPWQNGKAGRMNRTLAQEWQYARAWQSEGARASALAPSWSTTIGTARTARAGACPRCHA